MNRNDVSARLMTRTVWFALAVLLLTTVHHVYGAYLYQTPWRLHVGFVSGFAAAAILGSFMVARRGTDDATTAVAFWSFAVITLVFPVLLIGVFEGGYNHVLKNALYFGGASPALLHRLFPPPTYEKPGDLIFEMTGVFQLGPGLVTGFLLCRLVRLRFATPSFSPPRPSLVEKPGALSVGDILTKRVLTDVSGQPVGIPDSRDLLHLQFRRFAGCPVCTLHLGSFVRRHHDLARAGIREVVFFHSTADELRPFTTHLPFPVIADPDKRLYRAFAVESSPRALLDPRAWGAIVKGLARSASAVIRGKEPVPSLTPAGGRFGLPADFLIAPDGRVLARKYGCHADDQWSVEEVIAHAREATEPRLSSALSNTRRDDQRRPATPANVNRSIIRN